MDLDNTQPPSIPPQDTPPLAPQPSPMSPPLSNGMPAPTVISPTGSVSLPQMPMSMPPPAAPPQPQPQNPSLPPLAPAFAELRAARQQTQFQPQSIPTYMAPTVPQQPMPSLYPTQYNPAYNAAGIQGMVPPAPVPTRKKKIWLISGVTAAALAVIGVSLVWYIPNTPSVAFTTGIGRTGTMVNDIVNAATSKDALASYKTTSVTGSANATLDGTVYNGTFYGSFDKISSDSGFNITMKDSGGQTKQLGFKALSQIPTGKTYPDIYFQITGLQALGIGDSLPQLTQYDGKWILVSSDYLKSIGDSYLKTSDNTSQQITADDITAFAKATASVTKDYVFSTKSDKAVLVKKSFVGKENMDGVNTYHYKVAINVTNAKAYCIALDNAVFGTQVYKKLIASDTQTMTDDKNSESKDCSDGVASIVKDYPSFDMWIEGHYKLIHKIRLYDPNNKTAYTDIGQTYQGGNKLAFFANYSDTKDKTTGSFTFDTNTDTDVSNIAVKAQDTSNDSPYSVSVTMQAKAQSSPVKITKPASATSIQDVLNALGVSSTPQAIATQSTSSSDTDVETSIDAIDVSLEAYYADNGYYPTLVQLNDADWRASNMPDLDSSTLTPPNSKATTLAGTASKTQFGYAPTGCNTSTPGCQGFTLSGLLSDGSTFSKQGAGTLND